MIIDIFGRIQYVHGLTENIDIAGDRLYVFLKEHVADGKTSYEYLGSMLSTLEDKSDAFFKPFLSIATHYAVPPDESLSPDILKLKQQLDEHDRALFFEGKEEV